MTIHEVMLAVSSSLAASILAKATVAAALGLVGAQLARRSRAAVRHAVLAAAFGALLALPVASVVAPPVRIVVPAAQQRRPVFLGPAGTGSRVVSARADVGASLAAPGSMGLSLSAVLLAGWIAGSLLFLLPVVMGFCQVLGLRRSALPWQEGQPAVDRMADEAGIHRRVAVLLDDTLSGPMTCGLLHPAILLPEDARNWEAQDVERAIVHELEHVRRHDWLTHCVARAVCAVYWFHPLVWMAWRRLALEAERACDDAVVGRSEATAYADQLVSLARRLSVAAKTPAAKSPLLAMANRADLAARVGAVLDRRQQRGRAGTLAVALASAAAAVLVVAIAPLVVVAAPQSADAGLPTPSVNLSVTTNLVVADVVVQDQNGNAIEGLGARDFVLHEDGVPQNISFVEFQKLSGMPEGAAKSASSYYILGYYTLNSKEDGKYRNIKIAIPGREDRIGKLDYRAGYYATKHWAPVSGQASSDARPRPAAAGLDLNVKPPVLLSKVEPAYSDQARKAKYQGTVLLTVDIDADGKVAGVRVARSLGLGLDEKAVEAVTRWKFAPAMKDLRPVPVTVQVEVNFRLL
ncbi:MAG TPA: TonB family protein [Bryobacteraceae bacterium]|nr:TonB family protein [Bryobacteraceae bacterium]